MPVAILNLLRGDIGDNSFLFSKWSLTFMVIVTHFNSTVEDSDGTLISLDNSMLDLMKHSTSYFKENFNPNNVDKYGGIALANGRSGRAGSKNKIDKEGPVQINRKLNKTIKDRGDQFKYNGNASVSLSDSMNSMYSHRVKAIGLSGGVWVGWKDSVSVEDGFSSVVPTGNIPWATIRDFNALLISNDKKEGCRAGIGCPLFDEFLEKANLHYLGFKGLSFTWHRRATFERLDRVIRNNAWIKGFPSCSATHLHRLKSDHRPLLFSLKPMILLPRGRPFRFLAKWVEHPNFSNFVRDKWFFNGNMAESLNKFSLNVKDWNKNVYGHIGTQKQSLL
ncbi:hypothetical protein Gohar_015751 [Gossypium harknessii]|uniref:Uncharacterized protein n=1 Tax=Gossypium harknessii TaxID=34285 RepID=A0A7J9G0Q9_9ROSI|nr:hypothetical protein [Gossypium harknessii]